MCNQLLGLVQHHNQKQNIDFSMCWSESNMFSLIVSVMTQTLLQLNVCRSESNSCPFLYKTVELSGSTRPSIYRAGAAKFIVAQFDGQKKRCWRMPSQQQVFDSFSLEGQWVQMWWTTGLFPCDAELTHTGWEITYLVKISVVFFLNYI